MGYKNFYHGFKKEFHECIYTNVSNHHEVLIVELNGVFYSSLKKIYGYIQLSQNEFESVKNIKEKTFHFKLFEEIGKQIHKIIKKYKPTKKIFMVVDGVAAMMKNSEQRQRRYKNCLENKYGDLFDLNAFSPGTKLMHHMTKYIDWSIRKQISNEPQFQDLEIYFSNEKVFGEGEYKIMRFIRQYCKSPTKILIYTCDSDMILLSMLHCELHQIMIIRNSSIYGEEYIDINQCFDFIIKKFNFNFKSKEQLLYDFIILFSLMGNDYVASSPSVYNFDILFHFILPFYKKFNKHLLNEKKELERKNICDFLQIIGQNEKKWLEKKYENQNSYFPDLIFLQTNQNGFDFEKYKNEYNELYFKNNVLQAQKYYLDNMDNILKMYLDQNFDWDFFYPYYKAPFLSDIKNNGELLSRSVSFCNNQNLAKDMYFHLLTVLPPQSKSLLPIGLQSIFLDLKYFFPSHIEIDLTGKHKLWEGVVKLPLIDTKIFYNFYLKHKNTLSETDKKRNTVGKTFMYTFDPIHTQNFESYYGSLQNSPVFCKLITI